MRILAAVISLGRFIFGVVFITEPKIMDQGWIGKQARLPGAQVLTRAVGARDLAFGAGGLQAVIRNDGSAQQWLAGAAVCDAVDFAATYAAGKRIPRKSRSAVLMIAAAGTVLSAIAAAGNGKPGNEEPLHAGPEFNGSGTVPSEAVGHA